MNAISEAAATPGLAVTNDGSGYVQRGAIVAAEMVEKAKLITLDDARTRLAASEPLSQMVFELTESGAGFRLDDGWDRSATGTTPLDLAQVKLNGTEYRLTKDALLQATSLIGITKQYASKTPARLIQPQLDYWYKNQPDKELKAMAMGDTIVAFSKASIVPFSNLRIVDTILDAVETKYGTKDVLVDYKFKHDLRGTNLRIIVPEEARRIRPEDPWSMGIQIMNSLTGEFPTELDGYLFRWWCTNGAVSTHNTSGRWNRRTGGQGENVYEWARTQVDEILGGLEGELDNVQVLADTPIAGEVNDVLAQVFTDYHVPVHAREAIVEQMVESDDLTMYGVMQAITQAANDLGNDALSWEARDALMRIGGNLVHRAERCESCHRMLPEQRQIRAAAN